MPERELPPADESEFAAAVRDAIGAGPDEEVIVVTPQFERTDGVEPGDPPLTEADFDELRDLDRDELLERGLRPWGMDDLWLFPGEWYPHIPAGLEVTDINGETEAFEPGVTDDDIRHGVLAYGLTIDTEGDG